MAHVNVNREVSDVFYRYKMPKLIAKVEGKGNGIKTVIVNMSDVAKALARPPTYPTKYFGCELGAQTQFDVKNDRFIVNGSHESVRLQDLLDGFIKKFVLCPECENPETNLTVLSKKQMIVQHCIACGHTANVDMCHKLTTYILKNPPTADALVANNDVPATTTPGKKEKKSKSKDSEKKGKKEVHNGNGDINASNHHHRESNHDSHHTPSSVSKNQVQDNDDDWSVDTSAAAVQARMEAISGAAKTMTNTEDLEKTQQQRIDMFYSFVKQRKVSGCLNETSKVTEIVLEAERLDIKDKATMVLAELLLDVDILKQMKQYHSLFIRFTESNEKAQKYLLGGFEQLVGKEHPDALLPKASNILHGFYELDILSEEVLLDWDNKPSKKYVDKDVSKDIHDQAKKFMDWLKNAEEESSGDDEDGEDDDLEVVYSSNGGASSEKMAPAPGIGNMAKGNDDVAAEDADDVNIDDI